MSVPPSRRARSFRYARRLGLRALKLKVGPESNTTVYISCFSVGAISVRISGHCAEDVELVPSLSVFRVEPENLDIDIRVEWITNLRQTSRRSLFDSGATWRLYEDEVGFQFDVSSPIFGDEPYKRLLTDRGFRHAALQMSQRAFEGSQLPTQGLDYPLDELLITHRLAHEKAIELHGTGIVRLNGEANLFVGHSGAGKSTTTRLWTAIEDVEVLSDDRIIVRRDEHRSTADLKMDASGEKIGIVRLHDRPAWSTGHSTQDDKRYQMRMYGTPWHGEAMFASPNSAALTRIFVLEHGDGNVITRLTPSQAVAELFARSFVPFHRHEYVESALVFLEELVYAIPVYRYAFEPDQRAVDKILTFHD